MTAASGHTTRATLEGVVDVKSQSEKCRSQSKRDRGYAGSCKGPREDMPIEGERKAFAVVGQGSRRNPVSAPAGNDDRTDAAGHGEEQRFVNQRPQQLKARGTERAADSEFPRARHRSCKQKICEVGAGDEKDKSGKTNQESEKGDGIFREGRSIESQGVPTPSGFPFRKIFPQAPTEVNDEPGCARLQHPIMPATEQPKKPRPPVR